MKAPNLRFLSMLACALVSASFGGIAAGQTPPAANNQANTVIGANVELSTGASAMMSGDWQRGIELTQSGITGVLTPEDRAAALANICAGYAALKQFKKGMEFCEQSLRIDANNWRAWQNHAACNLGLGKIEESLQDIQRGLQLNPDSDALQKTLAIARDYEKQQRERLQHLLES